MGGESRLGGEGGCAPAGGSGLARAAVGCCTGAAAGDGCHLRLHLTPLPCPLLLFDPSLFPPLSLCRCGFCTGTGDGVIVVREYVRLRPAKPGPNPLAPFLPVLERIDRENNPRLLAGPQEAAFIQVGGWVGGWVGGRFKASGRFMVGGRRLMRWHTTLFPHCCLAMPLAPPIAAQLPACRTVPRHFHAGREERLHRPVVPSCARHAGCSAVLQPLPADGKKLGAAVGVGGGGRWQGGARVAAGFGHLCFHPAQKPAAAK